MRTTVCLAAGRLFAPNVGGWAFLNWALGLRALGCQVIWLEGVDPNLAIDSVQAHLATLKHRLERYGFTNCVALCSWTGVPLSSAMSKGSVDLEAACGADLLLNLTYQTPSTIVKRFGRSALIDIDPGLTQIWISEGQITVAPHDLYFTIGETVGQPGALFPDCGVRWEFTPPPVYLPAWPMTSMNFAAPYTTITNWWDGWVECQGQSYFNRKRDGFLPFLELPQQTKAPLELAITAGLKDADDERRLWADRGWRIVDAHAVASTPWDYHDYVENSRGEFSCAKPSCVRLQNSWISDRTVCYLASGRPAVVQHTGPSRFLPDAAGLWRFHDLKEAAQALWTVDQDYERQCRLARALAEEYFDAEKVIARVLQRALA